MPFQKGHPKFNNYSFPKSNVPWNKGKHLSEETRRKISEARKGKYKGPNHPLWQGGKLMHKGYTYIYQPTHPFCDVHGYIKNSRFVMEKYLGRYLQFKEVIHHINKIKTDDRIENLQLCVNQTFHMDIHYH